MFTIPGGLSSLASALIFVAIVKTKEMRQNKSYMIIAAEAFTDSFAGKEVIYFSKGI